MSTVQEMKPDFQIEDDFPPVSYEAWRAAAEEGLRGGTIEQKLVTRTYDGIDILPLYTQQQVPAGNDPLGFPGLFPFARGAQPEGFCRSGWDLRQEYTHPELELSNQAILSDLEGGTTSIHLRFDDAARRGWDPHDEAAQNSVGRNGIMLYSLRDLEGVLAKVHVQLVAVALDAGAAFLPAAAMLAGLWQSRELRPREIRGAFNADPLGVFVREGELPIKMETALRHMAELASWTHRHFPLVTAVGVDTSPYHDAGATAAQDLAFGMATAVEYLRAMSRAGLPIDAAARGILFRISLGTEHFQAIAKLRAARRLWSRIVHCCGGTGPALSMQIQARTSQRVLTRRDPYVNLLRNTVAMFAAGIGGAQTLTSLPFDSLLGCTELFSRRVARNTVLVLQEEAHLHQVIDPAGGSYFLDCVTEQLAGRAWEIFQHIERQGGMWAAVQSRWVAQQIESVSTLRLKDIARRKRGITGVSEFPDIHEKPWDSTLPDPAELRRKAVEQVRSRTVPDDDRPFLSEQGVVDVSALVTAAISGATVGQLCRRLGFHSVPGPSIPALKSRSLAAPFEELRDASDAWQAKHGHRPRVFLANLGPVSHFTARATFAKNFFEAGGFEVLGKDGFSEVEAAAKVFAESGASIAVICSSDKLYPDLVPRSAPALKAAGARCVILAGNPGENESTWRAAGVDRFIFIKCDVLQTLRELLQEEGVL